MISEQIYNDPEPKFFTHAEALEITNQARKFLKQYVMIDGRRYKFTSLMPDYKYKPGQSTVNKFMLHGTLFDGSRIMFLSLEKVIDLFQNQ